MDPLTAARPLDTWSFDGTLRTYQAEVLSQIPVGSDASALHIVAPPGSGKTLLGLLLAAREGRRTVVLTPTVTIRQQWVRTARTLTCEEGAVSDDPGALGDLTVLTYQLLSVTGDSSPLDDLAREQWLDELVQAGRREVDAATWLAELAVDNPGQYAKGLRSRSARIRRRFVQTRPQALARVLHPNALELIERLVAAGVDTVVLDECHHLLDHWAVVVAYLAARIREEGGRGLLIGLTATLPSADDGTEYENYTQLLGDVDYEVPTPAVVKEGHLAAYRDHVWFTEPVPQEAHFIRRSEEHLHDLVLQVMSSADGVGYLHDQLQPPGGGAVEGADAEAARRHAIDRALSDDFTHARTCGSVLRAVAPHHPLVPLLAIEVFGRATTDDLLTALARFALARLLPDPSAKPQWRYVKTALADFGLHLTDRGIRRGRNPIESTLATSIAKDHAAVDILRLERQGADADRIAAVVVTDVIEAGNSRGLAGDAAPGALRVFELLASDPVTARLAPVLLTAQHLRVGDADAGMIAHALGQRLDVPVEIEEGFGPYRDLHVSGVGGGRVVAAVSELIAAGTVRLLVGTRGLLGEGWDCPAVNTLIDLTTVATSAGSQQLRGRTLRLDPAWPEKVAHNWSVACLIPPHVALDDATEVRRLRRRHGHLWGLSADGGGDVVTGLAHALDRDAMQLLERVLAKDPESSLASLQHAAVSLMADRAVTREQWRIGEPYRAEEREAVTVRATSTTLVHRIPSVPGRLPLIFALGSAGAGAAIAALSGLAGLGLPLETGVGGALAAGGVLTAARAVPPALRALRRRRDPAAIYRGAVLAVSRALQDAGRIGAVPDEAIEVHSLAGADGTLRFRLTVRGRARDRRSIADAVEELFAPVRSPRFLLRPDASRTSRAGGAVRTDAPSPQPRRGRHRHPLHLPVPQAIARRRADAELFAEHWRHSVSPCTLIELHGEHGVALLGITRSQPGLIDRAGPRATLWG